VTVKRRRDLWAPEAGLGGVCEDAGIAAFNIRNKISKKPQSQKDASIAALGKEGVRIQ